MLLTFTEEEKAIDEKLGYPAGYAKLCRHALAQPQGVLTPFAEGPPQRFVPYAPPPDDVRYSPRVFVAWLQLLCQEMRMNYMFRRPLQHASIKVRVTGGSFTLRVVVVYFLWFYFHGIGIVNAKHNHDHRQPQYSAWLTMTPLLRMVRHPRGGCSCSCGATKELRGYHYNTTIGANKDNITVILCVQDLSQC